MSIKYKEGGCGLELENNAKPHSYMKKAGIITMCTAYPNYGNRLQNFAVQQVIKSIGFIPTTYASEAIDVSWRQRVRCRFHRFTNYRFTTHKEIWSGIIARKISFDKFNKKYIRMKSIDLNDKQISCAEDYFVIGSDQVWNPIWYKDNDKELYFLTFAKTEQKICFAPSFGIDSLPENWIPWFKEQLITFNNISVREETGAKIIESLTGRTAEVLIDPTLMLDANEWAKIEKNVKLKMTKTPYILTYFIGEKSDEMTEEIEKIAEENHLGIASLLDEEQTDLFGASPENFIWLIHHASLIITDSYHASIFSIIFNKPFLVYPRLGSSIDMMSRINSLLTKFHLEHKLVGSGLDNNIFEAEYGYAEKQIELERRKVIAFLNESVN